MKGLLITTRIPKLVQFFPRKTSCLSAAAYPLSLAELSHGRKPPLEGKGRLLGPLFELFSFLLFFVSWFYGRIYGSLFPVLSTLDLAQEPLLKIGKTVFSKNETGESFGKRQFPFSERGGSVMMTNERNKQKG